MRKYECNGYIRISKTRARALYDSGKPVYILPCLTRTNNMWIQPYCAKKDDYNTFSDGWNTIVPYEDFDSVCTCYTYYNCNAQLGKYPAFYIMEVE